jgi:hypothetical protein
MKGPSAPIISQVEKRGSQKAAIFLRVSSGFWGFKIKNITILPVGQGTPCLPDGLSCPGLKI